MSWTVGRYIAKEISGRTTIEIRKKSEKYLANDVDDFGYVGLQGR